MRASAAGPPAEAPTAIRWLDGQRVAPVEGPRGPVFAGTVGADELAQEFNLGQQTIGALASFRPVQHRGVDGVEGAFAHRFETPCRNCRSYWP